MNKFCSFVSRQVSKAASFVSKNVSKAFAAVGAVGAAVAAPTVARAGEVTLTIPDIDKVILFDAAGKAFAVAAVVVAIIIGLRLFKRQ